MTIQRASRNRRSQPEAIGKVASGNSRSLRVIDQIAALPDNWDDEGAKAPSASAVSLAARIINSVEEELGPLVGNTAECYDIEPVENGGILLEWEAPGRFLVLSIKPDGRITESHAFGEWGKRRFTVPRVIGEESIVSILKETMFS